MSNPMPFAVLLAVVAGCNSPGTNTGDAAPLPHDANVRSDAPAIDTGVPHDAGPPIDAFSTIDAPGSDAFVAPIDAYSPPTPDSSVDASSGAVITPDMPGASDVRFAIDSTAATHPISPYIYGLNAAGDWSTGATITRFGGNRITAYNWETNASNAGSDYMYENDNFLCSNAGCTAPGETVRRLIADAQAHGGASLIGLQMAGYVAADEAGPAPMTYTPGSTRFLPAVDHKPTAFTLTPSLTDGHVYEDEFVNWIEATFPASRANPTHAVFYQLDNEPDLWSSTHSEIHPAPVTYAEMASHSISLATAVKNVAPDALVFGFVSYGWAGYANLQSAPDAGVRDFINFFLDSMHTAETSAGHRLLDVLDLHWYPEATGGGTRIIDPGSSAALVAARVQAPRSLWDPSYVETSWITGCCSGGAIRLIPRVRDQIAAHYPGTRLSFSEYNYGGGGHISGGIAEADVLGVFGRENVFAATEWPMSADESFILGGLRMFRNYDGAHGHFGDTSITATSSNTVNTSVYASVDAGHPERMIVVAINKTGAAVSAGISVTHTRRFTVAHTYSLTSAGATPVHGADVPITLVNAFVYSMPAYSVTTLVLE